MEVKIGLIHTPREIEFETEEDAAGIAARAEEALRDGRIIVWFEDKKARRIGVMAERISYIECAEENAQRVMGFGAS